MAQIRLELPWAADLLDVWKGVPMTATLIGHSLFCAGLAPEFKGHWLVHCLLTFLWGYGGGIFSALLIMDPSRAPIALFASNEVGLIWVACWWLVAYCPGGYAERATQLWYVKAATKSCTALLRALLIVSRVDLAAALYPGVAAAPLVLGTVAGCGGRLAADCLKFGWGRLSGPAEMSQPGFTSRSAFAAAAAYYALAHVSGALARREAAGLTVTVLMVQCLLTEPLGRPLDFTEPLADLVHRISCVPKPGASDGAAATPAKPPRRGGSGVVASGAAGGGARRAATPARAGRSGVGSGVSDGDGAAADAPASAGVTRAQRRSRRVVTAES